ncbi:cytochrome P450 [Cladochytrium replicatum]|nr:cytochrome P450 [Cladochytrium replicatum]
MLAVAVLSAAVLSLLAVLAFLTLKSRSFRAFVMRNFASQKYLLHQTLPGPPVLPILGNFLNLLDTLETGENHLESQDRLEKYSKGGTSLIQQQTFGRMAVISGDAELCKMILAKGTRADRFQRLGWDMIEYGLFAMPSGDIWKAHRKGIQPGFGPSHLRHTFTVTNAVAKVLVDGIDSKLDASRVSQNTLILEMYGLLSSLTIDVLAQVAFSSDFGALPYILKNGKSAPEFEALGNIFDIIVRRAVIPKFLWTVFGVSERDTWEIRKLLHGYVRNLLSERVVKNGTKASGDLDVMDRLLATDENGKNRFSEKEIVDELIAFMLAGQETTANTMTWSLLELSRHPDLAEELEAEIDNIFDTLCSDDKLTLSDTNFDTFLAHAPKLDAFFKEVQRFHPVVAGIGRRLPDEVVTLAGHTIDNKKNVMFIVRIRGLHFNEQYWKDPKRFNPARWNNDPIVPGSFLPFADGPHNCIGKKMAVIEAMTVLAILIRNFRFKLVPGQHLRGKDAVTTGFRDGLKLEIERRRDLSKICEE